MPIAVRPIAVRDDPLTVPAFLNYTKYLEYKKFNGCGV